MLGERAAALRAQRRQSSGRKRDAADAHTEEDIENIYIYVFKKEEDKTRK